MNWSREFIARITAAGTLSLSHFRIHIPIYEFPRHVVVYKTHIIGQHLCIDGLLFDKPIELPVPPKELFSDILPERKNPVLK